MEWYYPILGGALRGPDAEARIDGRWGDFVVSGLGIRCVDDRPWVTGAETCELVLALDALGDRDRALEQFANMQHLRERDGSYWTGLVFADGKRWPVERTTWTGAAVVLAADALSGATGGRRHLPRRAAPRSGGRLRLRMRGQRASRARPGAPGCQGLFTSVPDPVRDRDDVVGDLRGPAVELAAGDDDPDVGESEKFAGGRAVDPLQPALGFHAASAASVAGPIRRPPRE